MNIIVIDLSSLVCGNLHFVWEIFAIINFNIVRELEILFCLSKSNDIATISH